MNLRIGIVLIVRNKNNELLVLQQNNSKTYSFISGGIEKGETPEGAVIREAKEEVGLVIDSNKLINTDQKIRFTGSRKGPAEQLVFIYKLEEDQNLEVDNNEISDYKWCHKEEAVKLLENKPPLIKLIKSLPEMWE